jgi:hypothetical protein
VVLSDPATGRREVEHRDEVVLARLEEPGGQVTRASLGRRCRSDVESLYGHDPVEAEQANALGPVAPPLQVGVSLGVQQPERVDVARRGLVS